MTADLLVKCTGQAKRKRDETQEQFLKRITHLYCSEKGIENIVSLHCCGSSYNDMHYYSGLSVALS